VKHKQKYIGKLVEEKKGHGREITQASKRSWNTIVKPQKHGTRVEIEDGMVYIEARMRL
jgi:hypothetical protein